MPLNADRRKKIARYVRDGMVVPRSWLLDQGFERHGLDNLLKSQVLEAPATGVYKRPDTDLKDFAVVFALQFMLNTDLVLGGLSALDLHGLTHYMQLGNRKTLHLYGNDAMPKWVHDLLPGVSFVAHRQQLLPDAAPASHPELTESDPGQWFTEIQHHDFDIRVSTPERAFMEMLPEVPRNLSFHHADQLMEGMTTLSPRRIQQILEVSPNVKSKRLLLWFAERHNHPWFKKLDLNQINLGSGNRSIEKGGKLDKKYLITVPNDLHK